MGKRTLGWHAMVMVGVLAASSTMTGLTTAPAEAASPGNYPSDGRVEISSMRTATSRTYQLPNGRLVTQLFAEPIYYQPDGSTDWQPIDAHFTANTGSTVESSHAAARLTLDAADSVNGFLRLAGGGQSMILRLPNGVAAGRNGTAPVVQDGGAYVDYTDFLPGGVGLRVFPHPDGFKMFLVLNTQPTTNSFSFALDAPSLVLGPDPDAVPGALRLTDSHGDVVGRIPVPYMMDSSVMEGRGGGLFSDAVAMSASGGNGHWILTLTVDPTFLSTATYPVYVDPSTDSFPNAAAAAVDTFASSKYPGTNFNTYQRPDSPYYHEMWLGNEPGTNYYNQVFMRFKDLDTTLGVVQVDSAYLEFYLYWQYWHSDPRQSFMKRVTSGWQQNQLTWNNRPDVEPDTYMSFYTTQGHSSHVDVTQYVQDVVDGTWVNNGLQINGDSQGQGGWKRIVSLNEDDPSNANLLPHLDITWEESETTGIDDSDDPDLTYEEMGYSQADIDAREAQLQMYEERDPTGLVAEYPSTCPEPCTGGAIPTSQALSRQFTILREQHSNYCVPAIVQSMLNYMRPSDNWANGDTISGVTAKQELLATAIVAARNAELDPDISAIPKQNGIGTKWGLSALNTKLAGTYRYIQTRATSTSDLRAKIKLTIHFNDAPVFLEIKPTFQEMGLRL